MVTVSFSSRLENIISITNAFVSAGKDGGEARKEAKFMEGEIMKNAVSEIQYHELCHELVTTLVSTHAEPEEDRTASEPLMADDHIFNPDGPTFGNYAQATFHKDGQMSTIFKAKALSKTAVVPMVALKVTTPSQMQPPHNVQREARILVQARHESIIPLLESFWHHGDRFVLVFPFMSQDLENLLRTGNLTKRQSMLVFDALFNGLQHLHSANIIHRDVKPSNVLLRTMDGPCFLADFGIAWSATDPESEAAHSKITDVGTTCYRPPEILFGDKSYDTSLDVWAAGCTVAEMMSQTHRQLFDAGPLGSELALIKSIFTMLGTPSEQTWPSVKRLPDWGKMQFKDFPRRPWPELLPGAPGVAIDFVSKTVMYESSTRLTASQALQHPLRAYLQTP